MLVEVNKHSSKKDIDLAVSEAAKEYMTEEGYDEVVGVSSTWVVCWTTNPWQEVTDFHLIILMPNTLEADMEDGKFRSFVKSLALWTKGTSWKAGSFC